MFGAAEVMIRIRPASRAGSLAGRSLGVRRLNSARIQAPNGPDAVIGKPDGAQTDANGITTGPVKLLDDLVADRIDPCDGEIKGRRPNRPFAHRDFPAAA